MPEENKPSPPSTFLALLDELHTGKETLLEEIDADIAKAQRALDMHGGSAEVTIKLKFKREEAYDNFYKVSGGTNIKVPKGPAKAAPMFGDRKNGGFTAHKQEQKSIFDSMQPAKEGGTSLTPASTSTVSPLKPKDTH